MISRKKFLYLWFCLTFTQDDWLSVPGKVMLWCAVQTSRPWKPKWGVWENSNTGLAQEQSGLTRRATSSPGNETPKGNSPSASPQNNPKTETVVDRETTQQRQWIYLSIGRIISSHHLLGNHSSIKDIFQYYNNNVPANEMVFKRTPSPIGRNVELCHPPKVLDRSREFWITKKWRAWPSLMVQIWTFRRKFVYITYAAVRDDQGDFQGVLEYVQIINLSLN